MTTIKSAAGDLRVEVIALDGHYAVLLARGDGPSARTLVVAAKHVPKLLAAVQDALATLRARQAQGRPTGPRWNERR